MVNNLTALIFNLCKISDLTLLTLQQMNYILAGVGSIKIKASWPSCCSLWSPLISEMEQKV